MPYIRHRDRMVTASILQDLKDTLIACRWLAGTTSKPVWPVNGSSAKHFNPVTGQYDVPDAVVVTTAPSEVLPLLQGAPMSVIDYFPETEGTRARNESVPKNTFAMDSGQPSDPELAELGSDTMEQEYVFNFAFYAVSDAAAIAVMSDLRDRYQGRIVAEQGIGLLDLNSSSPTNAILQMDIESFRYARPSEQVTPADIHLFFAELTITDWIESAA
jgi:hypothetical protein